MERKEVAQVSRRALIRSTVIGAGVVGAGIITSIPAGSASAAGSWSHFVISGSSVVSGGSVSGWTDYWTYRTLRGYVEMRLTDVTPDHGAGFEYFYIDIRTVDRSGTVRNGASLVKRWGALPGWTRLWARLPETGTEVRFRITHSTCSPALAAGTGYSWRAEVRHGVY